MQTFWYTSERKSNASWDKELPVLLKTKINLNLTEANGTFH